MDNNGSPRITVKSGYYCVWWSHVLWFTLWEHVNLFYCATFWGKKNKSCECIYIQQSLRWFNMSLSERHRNLLHAKSLTGNVRLHHPVCTHKAELRQRCIVTGAKECCESVSTKGFISIWLSSSLHHWNISKHTWARSRADEALVKNTVKTPLLISSPTVSLKPLTTK